MQYSSTLITRTTDGKVKTTVKNVPIDFYFCHNFSKSELIDFISFAM